jgi:hypothetical protein
VIALVSLATTSEKREGRLKTIVAALVALAAAGSALAQTASPTPGNQKVRHIIGLDNIKANASGQLTLQDGILRFAAGKAETEVPITSIDDLFLGAETTQSGGKTGRVVKTAAMAAPFESGKALTILMRTKVDILTVAFHDPDGAVHGAIFALPKGQGESMRTQLIQAGAHTSQATNEVSERSKP